MLPRVTRGRIRQRPDHLRQWRTKRLQRPALVTALPREHIHFVTGRLAEYSLRGTVEVLAADLGFSWEIGVLPITVAALMTPDWIAKRIKVSPKTTRVLIPGYCHGDLQPIE